MARILNMTIVKGRELIYGGRNVTYIIFTKKKLYVARGQYDYGYSVFQKENGVNEVYFTLDKAHPMGKNIVRHRRDTNTRYGYTSINKSGFRQDATVNLRHVKEYVIDSDEANQVLLEVLL